MIHYTTHGGRLHHFGHGSDLEEQVTEDRSYFVATGPRAFANGEIVTAWRHKPGVLLVMVRSGDNCMLVYSRDEFLPSGALDGVAA